MNYALIAFFLILAGVSDAICDAWRDGLDPFPTLKAKYPAWYRGSRVTGKSPYANNGLPWQSDFWHASKDIREYSWCLAIGAALGGWFILLFPVFAFIKGKSFAYFYHKVLGA